MTLTLEQLEPYLPLIAADFAYGGYTMTIEPIELGSPIDEWALNVFVDLGPAGGSSVTVDDDDPSEGACTLANGIVEIVHDSIRSWPECPEHQNPLVATPARDHIEWRCWKGESLARLGQLSTVRLLT